MWMVMEGGRGGAKDVGESEGVRASKGAGSSIIRAV